MMCSSRNDTSAQQSNRYGSSGCVSDRFAHVVILNDRMRIWLDGALGWFSSATSTYNWASNPPIIPRPSTYFSAVMNFPSCTNRHNPALGMLGNRNIGIIPDNDILNDWMTYLPRSDTDGSFDEITNPILLSPSGDVARTFTIQGRVLSPPITLHRMDHPAFEAVLAMMDSRRMVSMVSTA